MTSPGPPADGASPGQPRRLGESLERVAHSLGTAPLPALETVFGRWPEAVGPVVAAHCRPVSLSGSTLVVAVDEPGWATELRYLGDHVLRRLEEEAGQAVADRLEVRVLPRRPGTSARDERQG